MRAEELDREARKRIWCALADPVDDVRELAERVLKVLRVNESDLHYAGDKLWRAFGRLVYVLAVLDPDPDRLLREVADQCEYARDVATAIVDELEEERRL